MASATSIELTEGTRGDRRRRVAEDSESGAGAAAIFISSRCDFEDAGLDLAILSILEAARLAVDGLGCCRCSWLAADSSACLLAGVVFATASTGLLLAGMDAVNADDFGAA